MNMIARLALVLVSLPLLYAQVYNNTQTIASSGVSITVPNQSKAVTAVFQEIVTGSPVTATVVINGCTVGNSCTQVDTQTYSGNANTTRTVTTSTSYHHYTVSATWAGGTAVKVAIETTIQYSSSSGGGTTLPTTTSILKGDGAGGAVAATAGTDYQAPLTVVRAIGSGFDGGGSALTAGKTIYFTVPFACTIQGWNVTVDTGTATVDVWKIASGTAIPTISNTITASAIPAISTGTAVHSTTLTGWTTSVAANDVFGINLKVVSSATLVSLVLQCQ